MEVSSLKKKFKDKRFAAGCSRDVIAYRGGTALAGNLTSCLNRRFMAMRSCEASVEQEMKTLGFQE